ncbi:hypothetical protein LCGC14_2357510, partial [marine sediment metagenome]
AKSNSIVFFLGNPRGGKAGRFIGENKIDVLLSVNYIYLIEQDLIDWPDKYAINLHGSLLPRYRGRTPHVWAIINNESVTGITAHLIDTGCDSGPVIEQIKINIHEEQTGGDLLEIFNNEYPNLIASVLDQVKKDSVNPIAQDHSQATYFGKRTPDDGKIQWTWSKERIYNWVRAQSRPYPGAFSFYRENRIIIHKIKYSSHGFDYNDNNGLLINTDQNPIIKTPNGCVEIIDYIIEEDLELTKGESLS